MKKKKLFALLAAVLFSVILLMFSACGAKGKSDALVGVWKCELYGSEQIIEFTADGRFIDRSSLDENRYQVKGDQVEVYVPDAPESRISFEYSVKDGILAFGGAEYTKAE